MEKGEVKISLRSLDGDDQGEYLITDGVSHRLYSPMLRDGEEFREISRGQLEAILRDHTQGMTIADLGSILLTSCNR